LIGLKQKPLYDLTFVCRKGENHFAQPILHELKKRFSIQYLYPNHKRDYWHFQVKGKVIWVEWAHKFAHQVAKKKWEDKKVVVRFHRSEILSRYMKMIKWKNIDHVIFVNSNFENEFRQKISNNLLTSTIPNAIDVKAFPFEEPKSNKSICVYGYGFNPIKGYDSLILFFHKLLNRDSEFHLTIMGMITKQPSSKRQLKKIKEMIREIGIEEKITIIEKDLVDSLVKDRENVSQFLSRHEIILSFSHVESFHYSFAEGLLCGLQGFYNQWHNPLIKEFWNPWGCSSEEDMLKKIIHWSKLDLSAKKEITQRNRQYVLNNFGSQHIAKQYESLFFGAHS
jgi:glycosyltransferase involved in cell wall biosynthesis